MRAPTRVRRSILLAKISIPCASVGMNVTPKLAFAFSDRGEAPPRRNSKHQETTGASKNSTQNIAVQAPCSTAVAILVCPHPSETEVKKLRASCQA